MAGSTTTVDGRTDATSRDEAAPGESLALVVVWSADPARAGEVLRVPAKGARLFGRGDPQDADEPPRQLLERQRPGRSTRAAIEDPLISRKHLVVEARGDGIHVENAGKRPLVFGGREVSSALVHEGQCVAIRKTLAFVCVRRPAALPSLASASSEQLHAFGEADAYGIVGESPAAWALRDGLAFLGPRNLHVLLLGESGTGKELAARAIHATSERRAKKLVARNAATLPAGLIDAELFGHAANYPNPGTPERAGLIGEAGGSTLFLDEIGELSADLQAHLLRVLDDSGEYQRLGDSRRRTSDFRLVAATNRAVEHLKHDLAARLTLRLEIPGLNDRREDIPLLARHLLRAAATTDRAIGERFFAGWNGRTGEPRMAIDLMTALVAHRYTTHVRELNGLIWRSLATSKGNQAELTEAVQAEIQEPAQAREAEARAISAEEVRAALARFKGVKARVWPELGLPSRHALHRLMKKLGIEDSGDDE